ncbi:MAG: response regulator [Paludibacter sp.]|nr:response regulator [Paludibacter sp.]
MKSQKDIIILIAEDDDGHAELIIEGLRDTGLKNEIVRFPDGLELWDYLHSQCREEMLENNQEFLILLDINMPRMDGITVLEKIKNDICLKDIPVMMLTTTDDPREVERCYQLGCNVYITKPIEFIKFAEILQRLGLFLQIIKI